MAISRPNYEDTFYPNDIKMYIVPHSKHCASITITSLLIPNLNLIQEEIKRRLNLGNACYHSGQNLLSSCLLSENIKIKILRTIVLLVDLYECETWSLTLREEHRLSVFENRTLRRIFGPKRDEVIKRSEKTA
jgi:hypothetical protein